MGYQKYACVYQKYAMAGRISWKVDVQPGVYCVRLRDNDNDKKCNECWDWPSSSYSLLNTGRTQLKTMQAITSKINKIYTVTNKDFSKFLYTVLVLQSFYQVGVHSVQAVVCRVCVFWGDSVAMLRTAVGGVCAVCDKDCSKSFGTAGHQTLPAARQSLADPADSSRSACSVAETRQLVEIGCGYEASPRGRRVGQAYVNMDITWPRLPCRQSAGLHHSCRDTRHAERTATAHCRWQHWWSGFIMWPTTCGHIMKRCGCLSVCLSVCHVSYLENGAR